MHEKKIKRSIWLYFPEDIGKTPNCTESHYFYNLFSRNPNGVALKAYTSKQESKFFDAVREAHSRKMNNIYSEDLFYIIMDTDKECGNIDKKVCLEKIKKIADKYSKYNKVKIVLSSRSWEVWINMHFSEYTSPYHTQRNIEKSIPGNYEKNKDWYVDNSEILKTTLTEAVKNAKNSRKYVLNNLTGLETNVLENFLNEIPSWSYYPNLSKLWDLETITWMDFVIIEIDRVSGFNYILSSK